MMQVQQSFSGLTSASLTWHSPIQHVLVLKKPDTGVLPVFLDVLTILLESKGNLYVCFPPTSDLCLLPCVHHRCDAHVRVPQAQPCASAAAAQPRHRRCWRCEAAAWARARRGIGWLGCRR